MKVTKISIIFGALQLFLTTSQKVPMNENYHAVAPRGATKRGLTSILFVIEKKYPPLPKENDNRLDDI